MSENIYAPPESSTAPLESKAENIRRQNIKTEATIKSLGSLFIFFGGIITLILITNPYGVKVFEFSDENILVYLTTFAFCVGFIFLGIKTRKLHKISTNISATLCIPMLFGFPVGTLIAAIVLWSIFNRKGQYILSPKYKEIIAQTPHVKYRTSIITWILFVFVIALIAGGLIYASRS